MDAYAFDMTSDFQDAPIGTVLLQIEPEMMGASELYVVESYRGRETEVSNRVRK